MSANRRPFEQMLFDYGTLHVKAGRHLIEFEVGFKIFWADAKVLNHVENHCGGNEGENRVTVIEDSKSIWLDLDIKSDTAKVRWVVFGE